MAKNGNGKCNGNVTIVARRLGRTQNFTCAEGGVKGRTRQLKGEGWEILEVK